MCVDVNKGMEAGDSIGKKRKTEEEGHKGQETVSRWWYAGSRR